MPHDAIRSAERRCGLTGCKCMLRQDITTAWSLVILLSSSSSSSSLLLLLWSLLVSDSRCPVDVTHTVNMGSRLEYSNWGEAEAGSPALTTSPSRQPPSVLEVNGVAAGSRWNSEISDATDSEFSEAAPRLTAHEMALEVTACTFVMTPRERCQRNGTAFARYNGVTWWSFYKSQSKLPLSAQKRTMSRSLVFLLVLVIIVILALAVCIPTFWIESNRNKQNSTIRPFEQTTRDIGT